MILEAAFVRGGAAIGASASAEYTAPVDDNDDDSEHNAKTSKGGLWLNAQALFVKFVETLSLAAQGCAWLLFNTHTSIWDGDFKKIAEVEMQTLEYTYGFDELFKDATEENGVATVEVAKLRAACQDWMKTCLSKAPQAGDAEEDDETRTATNVCPEVCLRGKLHLHALETPNYTLSNLSAAWREAKNALTQEGGNETLFLLSAELFPAHASIHSPDMFKEIGHIDMEFYNTIAWMLKQRDQTDIVVVSDGRGDLARREIRKVFEKESCEEFFFF